GQRARKEKSRARSSRATLKGNLENIGSNMTYTVLGRPLAEQQLARLWTSAADRNDVASAADTIDSWLRVDPGAKGESRFGRTRILFVPPSLFSFKVNEEDRTVYVTAVGRSKRN